MTRRLVRVLAFGWALSIAYGMGASDGAREARAEAEEERESLIQTASELLAAADIDHAEAQAALRAEFGLNEESRA